MLMGFKKFHNKILVHMKTFDVTIDHILDHFVGSKLGLYVSFLIPLYIQYYVGMFVEFYYPVNGAVKRFDIFSTIFDSLSDASPIVQLLKLVVKISHIVNLGFLFPASHK